jgi:hypothetical protein
VLLSRTRADWPHGSISVGVLAALLSFTTMSLQFTSTALLSQVSLAAFPIIVTVPQTCYGANPQGLSYQAGLGGSRSYLETTPTGYPAFAEWVSNAAISNADAQHGECAPSQLPGIRDTGTVVRAFLPIRDPSERSRLVEYHGFGTVVDARVVCLRPELTNVTFSSDSGYHVTGLAYIGLKPFGLFRKPSRDGSNNFSAYFDCGFAAARDGYNTKAYGWPVSLCRTEYRDAREGRSVTAQLRTH